jgi:hypothetical protein
VVKCAFRPRYLILSFRSNAIGKMPAGKACWRTTPTGGSSVKSGSFRIDGRVQAPFART